MRVVAALEALGGFASRDELLAMRCIPQMIDLALYYRSIQRVRRGQYASFDTPPDVLAALRVGGRLACVSALAHHAGIPWAGSGVHVLVQYGASRLGSSAASGVVLHWSRRRLDGSRTVVSEQVARIQAAGCVHNPRAQPSGPA